jgi:hypothetical protein
MSARIDAQLEAAVPGEPAHPRGISQTWTAPRPAAARRRRPARRPLAPALAILGAPALVIAALVAFGSIGDRGESGLGSLSAASGLQGSAAPTEGPEPTKVRREEERSRPAPEERERQRTVRRSADTPSRECAQPSGPRASAASPCPGPETPAGGFDPRLPSQGPGSLESATGGSSGSGGASGSGTDTGLDDGSSGSGGGSGISGSGSSTSGSGSGDD